MFYSIQSETSCTGGLANGSRTSTLNNCEMIKSYNTRRAPMFPMLKGPRGHLDVDGRSVYVFSLLELTKNGEFGQTSAPSR
jgi:hypothetical protein